MLATVVKEALHHQEVILAGLCPYHPEREHEYERASSTHIQPNGCSEAFNAGPEMSLGRVMQLVIL